MKLNVRVILYAVAAMLCFMLWQRWQLANQPAPPAVNTTTSSVSSNSEVPNIQSGEQALTPNGASTAAQSNAQASLVHVKTDTYELTLSTNGASVVQANLLQYPTSLKDKSPLPLVHENNPNRLIIHSGIVTEKYGADGSPTHITHWQSAQNNYTMADGQDTLSVPFTYTDQDGVVFTKTYTFKRGKYDFDITQTVDNQSVAPWRGTAYEQLNFGDGQGPGGLGHVATFTGAVMSSPDNRYEKIKLSDIAKAGNKQANITTDSGWVAMIQHYFLGAIVPKAGDKETLFTRYNNNNGDHIIGAQSELTEVPAGQTHTFESTAYVGPKIAKDLEAVAPYLDKTVDYGWLFMISAVMFKVMAFIHSLIGNWGWAIVIMTLLIKLIFFMPSAWAYKSMAKMRALQPEMTRLRERYGDDRAGMSREMMALYKKEKVNPASGCIPMLLQIPFFIAFYYMLAETVELRQAPWVLWIQDLSIMDPYFILPIINASLMFLQQRLNPPPADPMQQKVMMMLPLVFGFMFMWFPAGLVLYWTVSNGFGIVQQYVMNKRYGSPAQAHKK